MQAEKTTWVKEEAVAPTGRLEIIIKNANSGYIVDKKVFDNLVVNNFGNQTVYLVGGENLTTAIINRVGLGTGGGGSGSGDPGSAHVTDTSLTDPASGEVSALVTSVTYGTSPVSVTFEATFGSADANGISFTEAGLLFAGASPNLAAHRVFSPMTKSSLFEWTFRWTLQWS